MVLLRQKVNVPGRHYSNQLAAHFARFCHGDPRETVSYFCFKYIPHRVPRTHHHWVGDKTLFKFLAKANSCEWNTQAHPYWEKKITFHPNVPTLTLRTSLAWNSAVQLWWIIPIPPINWKENREISQTFSKPIKLSLVFAARATSCWNKTHAAMFVCSPCTHCHGNGHGRLRHCIHGRRNERSLQGYLSRQCRR